MDMGLSYRRRPQSLVSKANIVADLRLSPTDTQALTSNADCQRFVDSV